MIIGGDGGDCKIMCGSSAVEIAAATQGIKQRVDAKQRCIGPAAHLPHISSNATRRQCTIAAATQDSSASRDVSNAAAADAGMGASVGDIGS
jgi:hypothetical protein